MAVQRINIDGIRNHEWFKKNYVPVRMYDDEDVNLDDVEAAFDDSEVSELSLFNVYVVFPNFLLLYIEGFGSSLLLMIWTPMKPVLIIMKYILSYLLQVSKAHI